MKSIIAAVLSAILLLGLPLAGATAGAWTGEAMIPSHPDPAPDTEDARHTHRCGLSVIGPIFGGFVVGGVLGLGTAVACTIPLAVWSISGRRVAVEQEE